MAKTIIKLEGDELLPVDEVAQEYFSSIKHLSVGTQKEYREELTIFSQWCATQEVTLDQINHKVINSFVEHLKATHKPHKAGQTELSTYTLAGYVRVIQRFLNWCLEQDEYEDHMNVAALRRIKKPKVIETIIETFSAEQIEALFKACVKEESEHLQVRDRAILGLLIDTGIRASELVTLTIGNVHLDVKDPHIRVFGKGSKWGEVGLGEQSRRHVQKYIRVFRTPTIAHEVKEQGKNHSEQELKQLTTQFARHAPLIVSRYGEQLTVSGLEQVIERLSDWAGIEDVRCSPHTFRHYFSINFIRQGGSIYVLSKLLRHSSVKVTENYLKSLRQSEARIGAKSVLDNL